MSAQCFQYVACDIPAGKTIDEWRRDKAHAAARTVRARRRLRLRLRGRP